MGVLLADVAMRATIILIGALVTTVALRRAAAATRHLVWTLAVVGVLAMPALAAILPEWHVMPAAESVAPQNRLTAATTTGLFVRGGRLQPAQGRFKAAPAKPLAATALHDPSEDAREKATMALALRSEPDVIDALLGALEDESSQVREKAALGLALRRDPRVVDALLDAAADPDPQVREKVAIALSLSGDARAIEALTRILDDPDPQVREKAASGLALFPVGDAIRSGISGALDAFVRNPRQ